MAEPVAEVEVAPTGMMAWSEKQYMAWIMYGVMSIVSSTYWLQSLYQKYWMYNPNAHLASWNTYTKWGLANSINTIGLAMQWVVTLFLWLATMHDWHWANYFLVKHSALVHYVQAMRFAVVSVLKVVGYFTDQTTDYNSYNAWDKTYMVSADHNLNHMDLAFEMGSYMVSFGCYADLATILDVPRKVSSPSSESEVEEEE